MVCFGLLGLFLITLAKIMLLSINIEMFCLQQLFALERKLASSVVLSGALFSLCGGV